MWIVEQRVARPKVPETDIPRSSTFGIFAKALSRLAWPREIEITLEVRGHDGAERRDEAVVLDTVRLTFT